jgi:hypothetical protein
MGGYQWICNNYVKNPHKKMVQCGHVVEYATGTLFEHAHLTFFQILGFINLWTDGASLKLCCHQLSMAHRTAIDWSSMCREILLYTLPELSEKIGGYGKVVTIDESNFKKTRKNAQWVFGGIEIDTGKIFMVTVPDRYV